MRSVLLLFGVLSLVFSARAISCPDHAVAVYTCVCTPGYEGDLCQTNINECASSPCQNGGTCVDGVASFNCTCSDAYSGALCQTACVVADTQLTLAPLPNPAYFFDLPIPVVNASLSVSDTGLPLVGRAVNISILSAGTYTTITGITDSTGSVTYSLSTLQAGTSYLIWANYSGDACSIASTVVAPVFHTLVPAIFTIDPDSTSTVLCGITPIFFKAHVLSGGASYGLFPNPIGEIQMSAFPGGVAAFGGPRSVNPGESESEPSEATFGSVFYMSGAYTVIGEYLLVSKGLVDLYHTNETEAYPVANSFASTVITVTTQYPTFTDSPHLSSGLSFALAGHTTTISVTAHRPDGGPLTQTATLTILQPDNTLRVITGVAGDEDTGVYSRSMVLWQRGVHTAWLTLEDDGICLGGAVSGNGTFTIYQCANLTLTVSDVVCNQSTTIFATLVATPTFIPYFGDEPTPLPLDGVIIQISFGDTAITSQNATTASGGQAFWTTSSQAIELTTVTATVENAMANYITDEAGTVPWQTMAVLNSTANPTQLSAVTALSIVSVGDSSVSAAVVLTQTLPTIGPIATGSTVSFLLTPNTGSPTTLTTTTDQYGNAAVSFSVSALAKGSNTIVASFIGVGCYLGSSSASVTVTLVQRTILTIDPVIPSCATAFNVVANLTALPQGTAVSGQIIHCDYGAFAGTGETGGATSATTNTNGLATFTPTYNFVGPCSLVCSFTNTAAYYADPSGSLSEQDVTLNFVIQFAPTTIDTTTYTPNPAIGGQNLNPATLLRAPGSNTGVASGQSVVFTLFRLSDNSLMTTSSAVTASDGSVTSVFSGSTYLQQITNYTVTSAYEGDGSCYAPSVGPNTTFWLHQITTLAAGTFVSSCSIPATVTATLSIGSPTSTPYSKQNLPIVFTIPNNGATCTGLTSSAGVASCSLTTNTSGVTLVQMSYAGTDGINLASSTSTSYSVTKASVLVTYAPGRSVTIAANSNTPIAIGLPFLLQGVIKTSTGSHPVLGRNLTFTLGFATANTQTCWGLSDSTGNTTCLIANVTQQLGLNTLMNINFAGDSCYNALSYSTQRASYYAWPSTVGTFVIGDGSSGTRTFLSNSWFSLNTMSQDTTDTGVNTLFKGFVDDFRFPNGTAMSSFASITSCNAYYANSDTNALADLPPTLPQYFGAIMTSTMHYDPTTGPGGNSGLTNDCSSNPCQNGGTCANSYGGGFYCTCPVLPIPFNGSMCESLGTQPLGQGAGSTAHGDANPYDSTAVVTQIVLLKVITYVPGSTSGTAIFEASWCPF